eukprot:CAMPEP_0172473044 /NCGR_PEP_ID=MMETSP1065-20121228/68655_1 /TAXON_ID=265537 /ORGANISM="Amphiprora paludosa, Strain CCMP125" /LENGTH=364 /DNA_ID=CAMNT_0013231213 /DNA_START=129 /DNA_END=1223 /DNA_ORIENTATION=+
MKDHTKQFNVAFNALKEADHHWALVPKLVPGMSAIGSFDKQECHQTIKSFDDQGQHVIDKIRSHYQEHQHLTELALKEWETLREMSQVSQVQDFQLLEHLLDEEKPSNQLFRYIDQHKIRPLKRFWKSDPLRLLVLIPEYKVWIGSKLKKWWFNLSEKLFRWWLRRRYPKPDNIDQLWSCLTLSEELFDDEDVIRAGSLSLVEEHDDLISDSRYLIEECGSHFRSLDEVDQESYIEELRDIEERWEVLMKRYQLMGILNPRYVQECQNYFQNLGWTKDDYKACHEKVLQRVLETVQQQQQEEENKRNSDSTNDSDIHTPIMTKQQEERTRLRGIRASLGKLFKRTASRKEGGGPEPELPLSEWQ